MREHDQKWGISTGLLFRDTPLDQAVRELLSFQPKVIELCPNRMTTNSHQIEELRRIRGGEGIEYTVHMADSFRPRDQIKGGVSWFRAQNRMALEVARQIDPLWLIQHPPITPHGDLTIDERSQFLSLLGEYEMPVLLETGVHRWNSGYTQVLEAESCRHPAEFEPLMVDPVIGFVADVPKMSRFRELPSQGRKSKDDLAAYLEMCRELGLPIHEVHISGASHWNEHLEFNQFALNQLETLKIKPRVLMIESSRECLEPVVDLVKNFVAG